LVTALERANAKDPTTALKILPDRVHPGASGHLLMAASLLEAWGATPIVTAVEIDAVTVKVKQCEHLGFRTGVKRFVELDAKG
jgi:hypothetical protein